MNLSNHSKSYTSQKDQEEEKVVGTTSKSKLGSQPRGEFPIYQSPGSKENTQPNQNSSHHQNSGNQRQSISSAHTPVHIQTQSPSSVQAIANKHPVSPMKDVPQMKERLVIQKIELKNFKSYAGKVVVGRLDKRFTAVIGPNGSGKSNLLESLLFVFGKRATKMRLKKISELIHNSDKHPNFKEASVEVFFEKIIDHPKFEEQFEVVDGTQFSIKRSVSKSNQSNYYFNNHQSTFEEVTTMMNEYNIDLKHNRFLILQGEVEQISLMKPKGLKPGEVGFLEYIEDVIGTSRYVEEIETRTEKLQTVREEKFNKENHVRSLEHNIKENLQDGSEHIEALAKERDIMKIDKLVVYGKFGKAQNDIQEVRHEIKQVKEAIAKVVNDRHEFTAQSNELMKVIEDFKAEQSKVSKQLDQEKKKLIDYEIKDEQLGEELNKSDERKQTIGKDISDQEKLLDRMKEEINEYKSAIPKFEELVEERKQVHDEAQAAFEKEELRVKEKTLPLKLKYDQKKKDMDPLITQFRSHTSEIEIIKNKTTQLEEQKLEVEARKENMERLQQQYEGMKAEIEKLNQGKEEAQEQQKALQDKLEQIRGKIREQDSHTQSAQEKYQRARQDKENVETGNKTLAALQGSDLGGILGRLGDLGTIEQKYDVAISCGYGGSMNMIVCETITDAERCSDWLKKNEVGRATFLALDIVNQQKGQMNQKFTAPPNSVRLFDQIKTKPEYRALFFSIIKNTLVTNSTEQALQFATMQGGIRTITLAGEVFETDFTSSGGRTMTGAMSSQAKQTITNKQLAQLEKSVQEEQTKLHELRHQENEVGSEYHQMCNQGDHARNRLMAEQIIGQAKGVKNEIQSIESEIESMQQNAGGSIDERLEDEERDFMAISEKLEQLQPKIDELTNEQREIESQISKVAGAKFTKLKEAYDQAKSELSEPEEKLSEMKAKVAHSDKTLASSEKSLADLKSEQEGLEQKIIDIKEEKQQVETDAKICLKKQGELEQDLVNNQTKLNDENENYRKLVEEIDQFKRKEKQLINDREELAKSLEYLTDKQKQLMQSMKKVKNDLDQRYKEEFKYIEDFLEIQKQNSSQSPEEVQEDVEMQPEDNSDVEEVKGGDEQVAMEVEVPQSEQSVRVSDRSSKQDIESWRVIFEKPGMCDVKKAQCEMLSHQITEMEHEKKRLQAEVEEAEINMVLIKELIRKLTKFNEEHKELELTKASFDELKKDLDELRHKRQEEFTVGFKLIQAELRNIYALITNGGDADLELLDRLNPFSDGIEFSVRPKNKTWKMISKLSGGEKTLSSLSLIFALHKFKPTPLYCLDEIDAALDFRNVAIIAKYLKEHNRDAQFFVISLREPMFSQATTLAGVYKVKDAANVALIKPQYLLQQIIQDDNPEEEEVQQANGTIQKDMVSQH